MKKPLNRITDAVARSFAVYRIDMLSPSRGREEVSAARDVAMLLFREQKGWTMDEIAYLFGRGRSTVVEALKRVRGRVAAKRELAGQVERLRAEIEGWEGTA